MIAVAACRSCRAQMLWALTEADRRMPLDAEPDPDGRLITWRDDRGDLRVRALEAGEQTDQPRYTSHFATCPNAATHRQTRGKEVG